MLWHFRETSANTRTQSAFFARIPHQEVINGHRGRQRRERENLVILPLFWAKTRENMCKEMNLFFSRFSQTLRIH